jgi:hypothetical protein
MGLIHSVLSEYSCGAVADSNRLPNTRLCDLYREAKETSNTKV